MAGEAAPDPLAVGNSIMAEFLAVQEELGGQQTPEEQAADLATPVVAPVAKPAKPAAPAEGARKPIAERVAERQAKREAAQRISEKEAAADRKLAEANARAAAVESTSPEKIRALIDSGDYDGAAKAWGFKSWNDMNDQAARSFASPEFKRVRALEAKVAEQTAREEKDRLDREQRAAAERETTLLNNFHTQLTESLPKAEDPVISALAQEDPRFVTAVFNRVVAAARQGEDLDPVEVAEELIEDVRAHFESLSKVFRPPSKAEAAQAAPPVRAGSKEQPVKPQTHVSRSTGTQASPPKLYGLDQGKEWLDDTVQAMKTAQEADRKALKAG